VAVLAYVTGGRVEEPLVVSAPVTQGIDEHADVHGLHGEWVRRHPVILAVRRVACGGRSRKRWGGTLRPSPPLQRSVGGDASGARGQPADDGKGQQRTVAGDRPDTDRPVAETTVEEAAMAD